MICLKKVTFLVLPKLGSIWVNAYDIVEWLKDVDEQCAAELKADVDKIKKKMDQQCKKYAERKDAKRTDN